MAQIIAGLNPVMKGWFEYFKHSQRERLEAFDGWIRMRLRSILRKNQGKKGRGRGSDHQEWPNAYFEKHGLFSLKKARCLALQSQK
jgi:RNA-directed DNA polymerase